MSSNHQQPHDDPRRAEAPTHGGDRGGVERGTEYGAGRGEYRRDSVDTHRGGPGASVPGSPVQAYGPPAGRWEYVPVDPRDGQRHEQMVKSTDLSLVLGILGVTVLPVLAPFALWQARKAERLGGRATIGKVLGWVGLVLLILLVLWLALILTFWGFAVNEIIQDQGSTV